MYHESGVMETALRVANSSFTALCSAMGLCEELIRVPDILYHAVTIYDFTYPFRYERPTSKLKNAKRAPHSSCPGSTRDKPQLAGTGATCMS